MRHPLASVHEASVTWSKAPEESFLQLEVDVAHAALTAPGASSHSTTRRVRFAVTLTPIFVALSVATPAKDIYLEKLGADPIVIGVMFSAIAFFTAFSELSSGRLQDNEALAWLFPVATWGRKAPWLLTHVVLLAVACLLMFLPPSRNFFVLHAWFLVVSMVLYWGVSTCIVAFESCRQELYSYNEDRANVELYCKAACIVGIGYAGLPLLVLLAEGSLQVRLVASALFAAGVLAFGLQALPVWREAKSEGRKTSGEIGDARRPSLVEDFRDTWGNKAFRHLCFIRLYDGLYQGVLVTNLLYYMTYILQLYGLDRSGFVTIAGLAGLVGDLGVAVIVGKWLVKRKNSFRIHKVVIVARCVGVLVTLVMLAVPLYLGLEQGGYLQDPGQLSASRWLLVAWVLVTRACQSPFTFWRVGAQCWVVDEDIQNHAGARREAAFFSVASAMQTFARAFASAVSFLGYGLSGLRPRDCGTECAAGADGCMDVCMEESIRGQPDAMRWYTQALFVVGVVFELLLVYHMLLFPIRGIRLAKLYNRQTLSLGGAIETGSSHRQLGLLLHWSPTEVLEKVAGLQHGRDVVISTDSPLQSVANERARQESPGHAGKKISSSVIFSGELASVCSRGDVRHVPPPGDRAPDALDDPDRPDLTQDLPQPTEEPLWRADPGDACEPMASKAGDAEMIIDGLGPREVPLGWIAGEPLPWWSGVCSCGVSTS